MNIDCLVGEEERIKAAIKCEYLGPPGAWPIDDGIVNPKQYIESSPRILWILKEPYCDGNTATGGDWSLTDCLNNKTDEWSRYKAFQPICYINYGIWKKAYDWNAMPWLRDCEEMRNGLKKIAFINVSKLPGLKWTPWSRIVETYQKYKSVIHDQIKTYAPNIIFACDPHANLILKDFGFLESHWNWFESAASIQISSEQRLVWVGHPSARIKRTAYVNGAIKAATAELVSQSRSCSIKN